MIDFNNIFNCKVFFNYSMGYVQKICVCVVKKNFQNGSKKNFEFQKKKFLKNFFGTF